jgi:hypothetical protein
VDKLWITFACRWMCRRVSEMCCCYLVLVCGCQRLKISQSVSEVTARFRTFQWVPVGSSTVWNVLLCVGVRMSQSGAGCPLDSIRQPLRPSPVCCSNHSVYYNRKKTTWQPGVSHLHNIILVRVNYFLTIIIVPFLVHA